MCQNFIIADTKPRGHEETRKQGKKNRGYITEMSMTSLLSSLFFIKCVQQGAGFSIDTHSLTMIKLAWTVCKLWEEEKKEIFRNKLEIVT